jgi:hypothetical protein
VEGHKNIQDNELATRIKDYCKIGDYSRQTTNLVFCSDYVYRSVIEKLSTNKSTCRAHVPYTVFLTWCLHAARVAVTTAIIACSNVSSASQQSNLVAFHEVAELLVEL